ncbi:hypothetical protein [Caulobacter segnis]|uniref:hypothetical protein n=1 Tax=Caulobacter segnis TaxID=88688 RepID=UPI00286368E9|nr:hypothetical protein [Caulobacter segnis]MDR6625382.1 hypothetical protein [Caulobacter segnis]
MKSWLLGPAATLTLLSGVAQAAPTIDVQSTDPRMARVTVQGRSGEGFPELREAFLRAVSEETLRRGCDWFDIRSASDTTRQRTRAWDMQRPDNMIAATSPYMLMAMSSRPANPPGASEPGVATLVTFGKGRKPDVATAADARAVLAKLN